MSFKKMTFKGKQVFIEIDEQGCAILNKGRATMKYHQDDDKTYNPSSSNINEISAGQIKTMEGVSKIKPSVSIKKTVKKIKKSASSKSPTVSSVFSKDTIVAYTDGGCIGNPGPSGAGYVIIFPDGERIQKGEPLGHGTNNIAELTAIWRVLQIVKDYNTHLVIHTDSSYSIGVLSQGWKAKANQQLIANIKKSVNKFTNLQFVKVKGHAGIPENELVDDLARISAQTQLLQK